LSEHELEELYGVTAHEAAYGRSSSGYERRGWGKISAQTRAVLLEDAASGSQMHAQPKFLRLRESLLVGFSREIKSPWRFGEFPSPLVDNPINTEACSWSEGLNQQTYAVTCFMHPEAE
jgi:hypothetical protein